MAGINLYLLGEQLTMPNLSNVDRAIFFSVTIVLVLLALMPQLYRKIMISYLYVEVLVSGICISQGHIEHLRIDTGDQRAL